MSEKKQDDKNVVDRFLDALQELGKMLKPNAPAPVPIPVRHDERTNRKR